MDCRSIAQARWAGAYCLVSGISTLLAVPLFLLVLVAPFKPYPIAWVLIFLTEFCLFFSTGPANTVLANVTHPALRSTGFAFNILLIHLLGDAISPPLIGKLSNLPGCNMNDGFKAVSLMMAISGVIWLFAAPHLQRDTERAPTRLERAD